MLSQPAFKWKAPYRYVELLNFEIEVANVLQAEPYDLSEERKVCIIKNWLGKEGLQFIKTLNNTEKEEWKSATELLNVLKEKFRPQHNEIILTLQYCKLQRKEKNPHKIGWAGSILKQQSAFTKCMISDSKSNL